MAKAIETGLPKLKIEEAAARTQARIDSGKQTIVGINKYRLDHEDPIDILEVDNTEVRKEQCARLEELKANRDEAAVKEALAAITECVKDPSKGNLLDLAVKAAGVRATLGEISDACEEVVGRYKAVIKTISGVYSSEEKGDPEFEEARKAVADFAKREGRQPRIMIAKMGQDGHDVAPRLWLPVMLTADSTLTWGRCSRLLPSLLARQLRMTFISSACLLSPQATRHLCLR